ncbi:hypothetical protein F4780DRAFT_781615 [Xylariomycetidae sp. FL0641]|nr:hypothetical protein F4780DRAFT_781615 [Xylariomycetidae sp. FL0641]
MATTSSEGSSTPCNLVVGIDFGTTYSGLAYARTEGSSEVSVVQKWPGQHIAASCIQAPTKLLYHGKEAYDWGYQIPEDSDPTSVISLFKLALEPKRYRDETNVPNRALDIENVDAKITDYLSGLVKHCLDVLESKFGSLSKESPMQFVLTIPAIWSDSSKSRTAEALRRVPHVPSNSTITVVSEPEAAAVAALKEIGSNELGLGDTFVVVDAGGGTVDLITYRVKAVSPILDVEEAAEGSGGFCGSSLVNHRFSQFLTSRLQHEDNWDENALQEALAKFDNEVKRRFNMDSLANNETFQVPVSGLGANLSVGLKRAGRFTLTAANMHMFFEPDILRIIQLVKAQINASHSKIRCILLVGGYGTSMYLRQRLQDAMEKDDFVGQAVKIIQPPNAWQAVVQGAAMMGLARAKPEKFGIPQVKRRLARKHYGHEIGVPFDESKHRSISHKKYWCGFSNTWFVSQMRWFIERGHSVSEDVPFMETYSLNYPVEHGKPQDIRVPLYADETSAEAPLGWTSNVTYLALLVADLRSIPEDQMHKSRGLDGRMYYDLEFQVEAIYRSGLTEYTLIHGGQRYDTVSAEYV